MSELNLREADRMEITILVDNFTDTQLRNNTKVIKRPIIPPSIGLLAEHGLSCLIKIYAGIEAHVALMDFGRSPIRLLHNAEVFKIDMSPLDCLILIHGHSDHFRGLLELLKRTRKGIPITLHPDAFLKRRLNIPTIGVQNAPTLDETSLKQAGVVIHKKREASTLCSDLILALGEVE